MTDKLPEDSLDYSFEISSPNSQHLNFSDDEDDEDEESYRNHKSNSKRPQAPMSDKSREENQTINAMAEEIQALEKLLEESAQVIGALREKYNDQKIENKHFQKKLAEAESDNEAIQATNEKLETKVANLENDVAILQNEMNLENVVNSVLSDEQQLEELNNLVASHRDLFTNEEGTNGFFEEYDSYIEKFIDTNNKQSGEMYHDIIANLKVVAQQACDHLVEIDEDDAKLKEQYPEVEFEKPKKSKSDEEASKRKKSRRKRRGEDFVYGSPSDRFPVMAEDPELDERGFDERDGDSSEEEAF